MLFKFKVLTKSSLAQLFLKRVFLQANFQIEFLDIFYFGRQFFALAMDS